MSAYVSIHPMPHRITVICPECGINHQYDRYPEAKDAAKLHNLFMHEDSINWAS